MNSLIHGILDQNKKGIIAADPSLYLGFKLNITTEDPEFVFTGFTSQVIDVSILLTANWGVSIIGGTGNRTSSAFIDASILGGTGAGSASGTCTTTSNCGGIDEYFMNCVGLTKDSSIIITSQDVGNCELNSEWDVYGTISVEILSARVTSGIGITNPSTGASQWLRTNQGCNDQRIIS